MHRDLPALSSAPDTSVGTATLGSLFIVLGLVGAVQCPAALATEPVARASLNAAPGRPDRGREEEVER